MALIVQKYGGTSVGTTDRIKNVARRVAHYHKQGHQLVIVVSAMSGETNRLLGLAKEISAAPSPRELDVIAATGEQVTIGLLAIALHEMGLKAAATPAARCASSPTTPTPRHASSISTRRTCGATSTPAPW